MSLLSVKELEEHVETDLDNAAIQRLIDDAEDEIDERYGALTKQTDVKDHVCLSTTLFMSRKVAAFTSVTEEMRSGGDIQETVLDSTDYRLRANNRQIDRLSSGTNPRSTWGDMVTFVYEPKDESKRRKRVTIDLVRLAVQYNAAKGERTGDFTLTSVDYELERGKLLARLGGWNWA